MTIKLIFLVTLLAYSMIVSQSFMYILSLKNTQLNLDAGSYTIVRKLIDTNMRNHFKYVIYLALFANLLLVIATAKQPGSLVFIMSTIALLALIADIAITLKGSLPVNDIINSWSADTIPSNWAEVRAEWFRIFHYRQVASIIGFTSLLTGALFGLK